MSLPLIFGPYGASAVAVVHMLRRAGANALWFHGFDPEAFDACEKHGVAACVEFPTFRADFRARPELVPIGVDGRPIRYGRLVQGVCLSQHAFLAEIEAALLTGLDAFRPIGIWLDYLTYGGWFEVPDPDLQESCFCPACVAEFCESTGIDADRPGQILAEHADVWRRHKCERIAGYAMHCAKLIRAVNPNCVIGAYMCPWLPDEFDEALTRIFAQDYDLLAPAVDVFTPLIYARKSGRSTDWGQAVLEASGGFLPAGRKLQPILDMLDFPESLEAVVAASPPPWGLQVFGGAEIFRDPDSMAIFSRCVERIQAAFAGA